MSIMRRFGSAELMLLLIVLIAAAASRIWYLSVCADNAQNDGPLQVQDAQPLLRDQPAGTELRGHTPPTELDGLVHNLKEQHRFAGQAPLGKGEETTAHTAPGYALFLAAL